MSMRYRGPTPICPKCGSAGVRKETPEEFKGRDKPYWICKRCGFSAPKVKFTSHIKGNGERTQNYRKPNLDGLP